MTRILVAISPLMYRQVVALAVLRHRPGLDVRLAAPEGAERGLPVFRPHLLVHDDATPICAEALAGVPCLVEVRYSDGGMHARVHGVGADGGVEEVRDASAGDLLRAVDGAADLAGGERVGRLAEASRARPAGSPRRPPR